MKGSMGVDSGGKDGKQNTLSREVEKTRKNWGIPGFGTEALMHEH